MAQSKYISTDLAQRRPHCSNCKEHWHLRRSNLRTTLHNIDLNKTMLLVELNGFKLGIDKHAYATVFDRHSNGQIQYKLEKFAPNSLPLRRTVHRQSRETDHGQGILGKLLARNRRKIINFYAAWCHGRVRYDLLLFKSYVRNAQIMSELILAGKLQKETIQIWIARMEFGTVVRRPKRPNLHCA